MNKFYVFCVVTSTYFLAIFKIEPTMDQIIYISDRLKSLFVKIKKISCEEQKKHDRQCVFVYDTSYHF